MSADPPFEDAVLRHAFGTFPSGVSAVCALRDGQLIGMAASSFTSVSLRPPLVSVCIARTSNTWPSLRESPRLGVSILADDQDHIAVSLAAKNVERFADLRVTDGADGAVLIDNSCLWLECSVYAQVPAGDHDIVLLEIHGLRAFDRAPLVFHGSAYRQLVFPG
ncbi:MAG: flavin reductase family protein [Jatrophihabitans sp.]